MNRRGLPASDLEVERLAAGELSSAVAVEHLDAMVSDLVGVGLHLSVMCRGTADLLAVRAPKAPALVAVVRSQLEFASIIDYLVEPHVGMAVRLRRYVQWRLESLKWQRALFLAELPDPRNSGELREFTAAAERFQKMEAKLAEVATAMGWQMKRTNPEALLGAGLQHAYLQRARPDGALRNDEFPKIGQLTERLASSSNLYRLLSGEAHGQRDMLLGTRRLVRATETGATVAYGESNIRPTFAAHLTVHALRAACSQLRAYVGESPDAIDKAARSTIALLPPLLA